MNIRHIIGLIFLCILIAALLPACIQIPRTAEHDSLVPQLTLGGYRFHVETFGSPHSPVVIVLHGGPGADSRYLLKLAALADQYQVVFYDQLGSGLSQRVDASKMSVDTFIRDLDAIVDHYRGNGQVRLIGHSWGAMLASAYVGQHPSKVERIVLAEPGFLDSDALNDFQQGGWPGWRIVFGVSKAWINKWRVSTNNDPYAREDWFLLTILPMMQQKTELCEGKLPPLEAWRFGSPAFQATLGKMMNDPEWAKSLNFAKGIEQFDGRVLFLHGACNTLQGDEYQRKMMSKFSPRSRARLVTIENAGHFMFNDQPENSLISVRQFLSEKEE